ncbi:MAG: cob(I)yrinic acid a,c-diamide adenosyltransferase [Thermodesulfobacteriota bacterium]|nr:cob(I)yrinic acid a,c-diamide adenosyltransferase [Thermodesulfobacteriota bacterium]
MKTYDRYTDTGGTLLADGKKLSKDSSLVNAIGAMDEANSFLGLIYAMLTDEDLRTMIDAIQRNLCRINSVLGNAGVAFEKSRVLALEEMIQELETHLPPLSNFILSGSGMLSAHIQFARSLVRTAERQVRSLQLANDNILPFLNRLSDVLFLIARTKDKRDKQSERLWKGE